MVLDINQIHCDHFAIYTNIKSCTPETMLYVNYTSGYLYVYKKDSRSIKAESFIQSELVRRASRRKRYLSHVLVIRQDLIGRHKLSAPREQRWESRLSENSEWYAWALLLFNIIMNEQDFVDQRRQPLLFLSKGNVLFFYIIHFQV